MIPLRDHNRPRRFPFLTYGLIAANVLVYLHQMQAERQGKGEELVQRLGLKPVFVVAYLRGEERIQYEAPDIARGPSGEPILVMTRRTARVDFWNAIFPFLASMFLHGNFLHLLGNMWFLHVFGDNVEDRLGRGRYLIFYFLTGLAASVAQIAVTPSSGVPCVGASGAISGVLGGYALLFPHARVLTLVPIFIFIHFVEIPAFIFLFIWFGLQVLSTFKADPGAGGVAWWAHIGGFVVGLGGAIVLPPRHRRHPFMRIT